MPQSKHIWFHEKIAKIGIKVVKVEAVEKFGNIFTKALPRVMLKHLQSSLQDQS